MRASHVDNVHIAGIASAVPDKTISWRDHVAVFGEAEMLKITQNTGIESRRISPQGICTSDLCIAAANPLLAELNVDRATIDAVFLVTQSPDYKLPATACSIAHRLGLSTDCAAFDINLGCSGYTYGLWTASHLIASQGAARVLLLAGETATREIHPHDRSAVPLFGDAGSATLLEYAPGSKPMHFRYGTDGAGQNNLIVPAGAHRLRSSQSTRCEQMYPDGNPRALDHLYMNGAEVFAFTIERVPTLLLQTAEDAGWSSDDVDAFVLHQANGFMLKHLARAAGIPPDKLPLALKDFGNTSSASIPLAMTVCLRDKITQAAQKLVLAGFGVGYSWNAVAFETSDLKMLPLIEVDCDRVLEQLFSNDADSRSHLPLELRSVFHARS